MPEFRFLVPLVLCLLTTAATAAEPDWAQILGESRGSFARPLDEVDWRENRSMKLIFAEAQADNRPIFVTFRCLPCKQCAGFDQAVLEGGKLLTPLLRQFVTVRLTDANLLDERIFPYKQYQDLDLSWWGYFLSPEGRLYGVFGGKDHVSDQTRISPLALAETMLRVLKHHHDPRRKNWNIDGPKPELEGAPQVPLKQPAYKKWAATRPWTAKQNCLHCHQVAEVIREPDLAAGRFKTPDDLYVWPLPENVGLFLERDHGLRVLQVTPKSPASVAGIRRGDELAAAGGRRLFSQADFQGVLHRGPKGAGEIPVYWKRDGTVHQAKLRVRPGWRKTQIWWRKSVYDGNVGPYPGFFPLKGPRQPGGKMSVKPFMGKQAQKKPVYRAGLRPHHRITAIGGVPVDSNARKLLTWFKLKYKPGDTIVLTVKERGKTRKISYRLPTK